MIPGEQMRSQALAAPVELSGQTPMLAGAMEPIPALPMVAGEQGYAPTVGGYPVPPLGILRDPFAGSMLGNNAVICTPCGAMVQVPYGVRIMDGYNGSARRWTLSGITKDSAGAALAACRVVVLETGRLARDGAPVVAETISNGSGLYSVEVPMNVAYQAIAYKPGSPDVAGITRCDVTPAEGA